MRVRRFPWQGATATGGAIRAWAAASAPVVGVGEIERAVLERGDEAILELTARFDAPERPPSTLRVAAGVAAAALGSLDPEIRAHWRQRR